MSSRPSARTTQIALLICGQLSGSVHAVHGGYYDVYKRFLENSLPPNSNTTVVVDAYDVVNEMRYPDEKKLVSYDAVMLTGSAASAYEDKEWINRLVAWIQQLAENHTNIKIIGICFGHQIVSRALGGKCVPNGGRWEIGPTTVQLTGLGKDLFGVAELVNPNVQQMHRDHVPAESFPALSSGEIHLLGSTELSNNQGFVKFIPSSSEESPRSLERIQIITTQGHPEFPEALVTGIVRQRLASGIFDAAAVDAYFGERGDTGDDERINKDGTGLRWRRNDGVGVIGNAFWKILGVNAGREDR